ncbi:MAG: hypothetical protein GY895_13605 [Phycisphaera sp.]|nr:hypothetical protein [Phycisphaera sp.]
MLKSNRLLSNGLLALGLGSIVALQSCGTVPTTEEGMAEKRAEVVPMAEQTLTKMIGKDPSIEDAMSDAYGYAVFPTIASGALIIGGEGGDGVVFEGGSPWGLAKLAKGSIGAQIGGETYSELVILTTEDAFKKFVAGDFQFSADLTATAVKAGAATAAPAADGMKVLVMTKGGLMASAAVGGQDFSCYPFDTK